MTKEVRLEYDGPIATITNDNVEKHNAFDDDMDMQLFAALAELKERPDVRAVIWRGEGKSFSSGRDVGAIGGGASVMAVDRYDRRGRLSFAWERVQVAEQTSTRVPAGESASKCPSVQ